MIREESLWMAGLGWSYSYYGPEHWSNNGSNYPMNVLARPYSGAFDPNIIVDPTGPYFTYFYPNIYYHLPNSAGPTLFLNNLNTNDSGNYLCIVSNANGAIMSEPAYLQVLAEARIVGKPVSRASTTGKSVLLTVTATGTDLHYQWQLNGVDVLGATSATLALNNLKPEQAGYYTVIVSNSINSVISEPVTVSLLNLDLYAGLTITGPVGSQHRIEYLQELRGTNWIALTNIALPTNPYLFIDMSSPTSARRFYRSTPIP